MDAEDEIVPLDFTTLGNRDVGVVHSRFAVRHSHAIFHLARARGDAALLKRDIRIARAKFRIRHKREKVNVVNAMMEDDEEIVKLEGKLAVAEAKVGVLDAVCLGYEDLRNAASREMTRRLGERAATD